MRLATLAFLLGLSTIVSAHFKLQFPAPRGVFVEDQEPTFCDGYTTVAENRTQFPLDGGFISFNSEHPKFTVGLLVSTVQNPSSFDNFSTAVNFFSAQGEGPFCFHIDLASNSSLGLKDGENATLQVVFDGGDGQLYQCADVVLSSSANVPSNVSCSNSTGSGTSTSGSSSGAPSPTASGNNSGAVTSTAFGATALLSIIAAVAAVL